MYEQDLNSVFLSNVQTDATLLANNSKHCWTKMLHFASVCTPCCVLLGVVAQSLKPPVKRLALCKGTQHCWEMLRPLSRTIVALSVRIGSFTVRTMGSRSIHIINSVKSELK